jgi:hypothetical protein
MILAEPDTDEEFKSLINENLQGIFWLGGRSNDDDQKFMWECKKTEISKRLWAKGEPKDSGGAISAAVWHKPAEGDPSLEVYALYAFISNGAHKFYCQRDCPEESCPDGCCPKLVTEMPTTEFIPTTEMSTTEFIPPTTEMSTTEFIPPTTEMPTTLLPPEETTEMPTTEFIPSEEPPSEECLDGIN